MEEKEMKYKGDDGETYVAPLSVEKMEQIYKAIEENNNQVKKSNMLKVILIIVIVLAVFYLATRTELIMHLIQRMVC